MLKYRVRYGCESRIVPSNSDEVSKESIESDIQRTFIAGGIVKAILTDKLDEIKSLYIDRIRARDIGEVAEVWLVNPLSEGFISLEAIE